MVRAADVEAHYLQVAVDPKGKFMLFLHLQPSFRSEFISVWPPYILIPSVVMELTSTLRFQPVCESRKRTYKLYPIREIVVTVPAETGNSS